MVSPWPHLLSPRAKHGDLHQLASLATPRLVHRNVQCAPEGRHVRARSFHAPQAAAHLSPREATVKIRTSLPEAQSRIVRLSSAPFGMPVQSPTSQQEAKVHSRTQPQEAQSKTVRLSSVQFEVLAQLPTSPREAKVHSQPQSQEAMSLSSGPLGMLAQLPTSPREVEVHLRTQSREFMRLSSAPSETVELRLTSPREANVTVQTPRQEAQARTQEPCSERREARLPERFLSPRVVRRGVPIDQNQAKLTDSPALRLYDGPIWLLSSPEQQQCSKAVSTKDGPPTMAMRRSAPSSTHALPLYDGPIWLPSATEQQWCSKADSTVHCPPTLAVRSAPSSTKNSASVPPLVLPFRGAAPNSTKSGVNVPPLALPSRCLVLESHEDAKAEVDAVSAELISKLEVVGHAAECELLSVRLARLRARMNTYCGKGFAFPASLQQALVLLERGQDALEHCVSKTA